MEAMENHGEAIIKQCQVLALKGDATALRPRRSPKTGH